eukprot:gene16887-25894_t
MDINIITSTGDLAAFCTEAAKRPYITVATKVLSEKCYYAKLCLVQLAYNDTAGSDAVLVDAFADGLSLEPLYALFRNETVNLDTLAQNHTWTNRPLSFAAVRCALADVAYLFHVYEYLDARIRRLDRKEWMDEAVTALLNSANSEVNPDDAWKQLKGTNPSPVARELARFREAYAQENNVPPPCVFKDSVLRQLALEKPTNCAALHSMRFLTPEVRRLSPGILEAIQKGLAVPEDSTVANFRAPQGNLALVEMLKVLLELKAKNADVSQKLIADAGDLGALAAGNRNSPVLSGWRRDVFGEDALRVCEGKVGLVIRGEQIVTIDLKPGADELR